MSDKRAATSSSSLSAHDAVKAFKRRKLHDQALREKIKEAGRMQLKKLGLLGKDLTSIQVDALIRILCFRENLFLQAPCGSGKSLVFLISLIQKRGIGIMVVPLRVIAQQYRDKAAKLGIVPTTLDELIVDGRDASAMACALIVVSPEEILQKLSLVKRIGKQITVVGFDECRLCIHWGLDFRKDFIQLSRLTSSLPDAQFILMDGSCTRYARAQICRRLQVRRLNDASYDIDPSHVTLRRN